MKKIVFTAALFAASVIAVNAQESYKPEVGSFGVEVAISPLAGSVDFQQGLQYDNNIAGQAKVSYYLNDKIGIRLGLGFGTSSTKDDNGKSGDDLRRTSSSRSNFSILPAFTYSFEGTERLTPYVGAGFAFGSCSIESVSEVGKVKTTTTNSGNRFNTFGFNVFTGFNYFFAKNLYVGVEVGIGFDSQKFKNQKVSVTGDPAWVAPAKPTNSSKNSSFGFIVNPILRLGWSF